ncbi:MAG: 30S ribosomal protein S4 [Defluviitaleaceae bacterium]|nr:30S ribosomal protein S4 [Defluviitaleaceae bacterium]
MARYIGPVCRLCRREGEKLFIKGERCMKQSCAMNKRPTPPGQHGAGRRGKLSEYGMQTREKQKCKRIYGVLEKQFRAYYAEANRIPGITGENLVRLLEMRLDNVAYRLGLGRSRTEARQVVRHNLITVNGKRVNIPSYQVKVGDVIAVSEKAKSLTRFKDIADMSVSRSVPEWLTSDIGNLRGTVSSKPSREQVLIPVNETLIVELYSK